jgi:hypothetical protein
MKEHVQPIRQRPYKLSLQEREIVKQMCDDYVKRGIAKYSLSIWANPVFLVAKPDGSWRMVADYRLLNKQTEELKIALPCIDDIYTHLHSERYFSILDIKVGYHSFASSEDDSDKSTIISPHLTVSFTTLPQGSTNSMTCFQRMMNYIFHDFLVSQLPPHSQEAIRCLYIYVDDLFVFSKTFEEHLGHLKRVF